MSSPVVSRRRILLIGRIDKIRWRKGGIHGSCLLLEKNLRKLNFEVEALDLDAPPNWFRAKFAEQWDLVLVYGGDLYSQDRFSLRLCMDLSREVNSPVYFGASWDMSAKSEDAIRYHCEFTNSNVCFFIFSSAGQEAVASVSSRTARVLPKPLRELGVRRRQAWRKNRKVFLGDLSKFLNPHITPDARDCFDAIGSYYKPDQIVFVQQYGLGSSIIPDWLGGVSVRSYTPNLSHIFRDISLYVHTPKHVTYEMLPLEAFGMGIPLMRRDLPQSLNEAIPLNLSPVFKTPSQLEELVQRFVPSEWGKEAAERQRNHYSNLKSHSSGDGLNQFISAAIDGDEGVKIT